MRSHLHVLPIALLSLLAGGCSHRSKDPNQQRVPGAGLLSDQGDGFTANGVSFLVKPMSIRVCDHPDLRMSTAVTWDARAADAKAVIIWVDDGTSGPKKWFYGSPNSHSETGDWIADNTTLRLVDGDTGQPLALRRIHVTQCLDHAAGALHPTND